MSSTGYVLCSDVMVGFVYNSRSNFTSLDVINPRGSADVDLNNTVVMCKIP